MQLLHPFCTPPILQILVTNSPPTRYHPFTTASPIPPQTTTLDRPHFDTLISFVLGTIYMFMFDEIGVILIPYHTVFHPSRGLCLRLIVTFGFWIPSEPFLNEPWYLWIKTPGRDIDIF